jgi:hypothetical protein
MSVKIYIRVVCLNDTSNLLLAHLHGNVTFTLEELVENHSQQMEACHMYTKDGNMNILQVK